MSLTPKNSILVLFYYPIMPLSTTAQFYEVMDIVAKESYHIKHNIFKLFL